MLCAGILERRHALCVRVTCELQARHETVAAAGRAFLDYAHPEGIRVDYVARDRDGKFVSDFDAALKDAGVRAIATAPQAPNQNAYVERWVKSICEECLHHFIVFGQQHFDFFVSSYADYYSTLRPPQGVGNPLLSGPCPEVDDPPQQGEQIVCHTRLGGLLKHYERHAA